MGDTARDIADGIMAEHAPEPVFSSVPEITAAKREAFRNAIASALTAYGDARLAEAVDDRDRYGRKWAAARAEIATLTARLAEADDRSDLWQGRARNYEDARNRLEAALREVRDDINDDAVVRRIDALLSPEPEGVVEEPPRDNAITDAW